MQNWIVWNGTVFDRETLLKLNGIVWNRYVWLNWVAWKRNVFDKYTVYLNLNCVLMLNWIV